MSMNRMVTLLGVLPLLAAVLFAQDLPHATVAHGGFAFPDADGTRLMALSAPDRPLGLQPEDRDFLAATAAMNTAFCAGGATHPVEFAGHQASDGKGSFRQTTRQFPHLDGFVFRLKSHDRLQENETCFVAADVFTRSVIRLALDQPDRAVQCAPGAAERIAAVRGRGVTHCWTRAREAAPGGVSVLLAEFVRQGTSALASLVVVDGDRLTFSDMPGNYTREGGLSVWRIEDEGTFDPHHFRVVLLARRGAALVLATSWAGAEGTVLGLSQSDGDLFRPIILDSWYQAPM
jgi:hypothetical protein